jgi:hypothetical protein
MTDSVGAKTANGVQAPLKMWMPGRGPEQTPVAIRDDLDFGQ